MRPLKVIYSSKNYLPPVIPVSDQMNAFLVSDRHLLTCQFSIFELGGWFAFNANEGHDEHMLLENDDVRTPDLVALHLHEVVHFLFGPQLDYFLRIQVLVAIFETIIVGYVLLSGLELVECCLEDFDGQFTGH